MRLSALLLTWPRNRPNGHIYLGKHKMVRKVTPDNMRTLDKDIQREKRNAYLCLKPYLSPEAERVAHAKRETMELRPDQLLFQLRKARTESTGMAPTHCEDGFKHLVHSVDWEHA